MYAVAFDLVVSDTEKYHEKGVTQAYTEIGAVLGEYGFRRVEGSLYVTDDENMANLFLAIQALRVRYATSFRKKTLMMLSNSLNYSVKNTVKAIAVL